MEDLAYQYYKEGYNCSACILKAAEDYFHIPMNRQSYQICRGIHNGFGTGSFCSVLIASVMLFGILFEAGVVKSLRIRLFDEFNQKYKDMNCAKLKTLRGTERDCGHLVRDIAAMTRRIIEEEMNRRS